MYSVGVFRPENESAGGGGRNPCPDTPETEEPGRHRPQLQLRRRGLLESEGGGTRMDQAMDSGV